MEAVPRCDVARLQEHDLSVTQRCTPSRFTVHEASSSVLTENEIK